MPMGGADADMDVQQEEEEEEEAFFDRYFPYGSELRTTTDTRLSMTEPPNLTGSRKRAARAREGQRSVAKAESPSAGRARGPNVSHGEDLAATLRTPPSPATVRRSCRS